MKIPYSGGASSVNRPDSATLDHQHTITPSSHSSEPAGSGAGSVVPVAPGFECSQTRITCEHRVAKNLDTLKLSLWIQWTNSSLFEILELAKKLAQEADNESEPIEIDWFEWNVMRNGIKLFPFRLIRGDVKLFLNTRQTHSPDGEIQSIPTAQLEIGSVSCWAPGYQETYQAILHMIEKFGGIVIRERVSEAHLCADVIGVAVTDHDITNEEKWITRAHNFDTHYHHRKLSGICMGKGNFMLRVYDKVRELKTKSTHKQELFREAWGLNTFDETDVTRVEFQLRRPVLREFTTNTLADLLDRLNTLWSYCTSEWCKFTTEAVDRNHHQSRAETHPFWKGIQEADWEGDKEARRLRLQQVKDIPRLKRQMAGLGMSMAAGYGKAPDDLEGIISITQGTIEAELRRLYRDRPDFIKRMRRKYNATVNPFDVATEGGVF